MSRAAAGVLLGGLRGTVAEEWLLELAREGLAGVVLFAENTPDVPTTRALTDALHDARADLLVMTDEEGGDVSRIEAAGGSSLPGSAALGLVDDTSLTRDCAAALGAVLALAGIDVALSPVLDVASEPLNPVIGVRSFGASAELVARHGRAWCQGLRDHRVATVAKHFPGHGDTTTDSHLALPLVDAPADLLRERDLAPFAVAGADAVMTAHVCYPSLGRGPASLGRWATDLVRGLGIEGPIVTDALGMRALSERWGLGEACVLALEAGADLLCLDSPQARDPRAALVEAIEAVDEALAAGRLREEDLVASAARTARLVRRTARPALDDDCLAAAVETLHATGERAARLAVRARGEVHLGRVEQFVDLRRAQHHAAGRTSTAFSRELSRRWPEARVVVPLDPDPHGLDAQLGRGLPTLVLTREPLADATEAALLDAVLAAVPQAVVIHAGMPAAAPDADRLVLGCGVGRATAAAALDLVQGR